MTVGRNDRKPIFCSVFVICSKSSEVYFFFLFCRIKKLLAEKKAKSERENNLIYHQKLPEVRRNSQ